MQWVLRGQIQPQGNSAHPLMRFLALIFVSLFEVVTLPPSTFMKPD